MSKTAKNDTLSRPLDSCNLNMDAMVLHGPDYRQVHARTKMQMVLSLSVYRSIASWTLERTAL